MFYVHVWMLLLIKRESCHLVVWAKWSIKASGVSVGVRFLPRTVSDVCIEPHCVWSNERRVLVAKCSHVLRCLFAVWLRNRVCPLIIIMAAGCDVVSQASARLAGPCFKEFWVWLMHARLANNECVCRRDGSVVVAQKKLWHCVRGFCTVKTSQYLECG